jgi:predicted transposase/invertase (TIGR01784 family)
MARPIPDRYISLLTDFGFKRIFGTEPNKLLLIDFLNTLLPAQHRIQDVDFKKNEHLGSTQLDRKAIFDIYCQAESGERFVVEIQKAKQNFFKDRSVYYATFPIQEQAIKGDWDFELSAVYTIGILDFIFDDHKNDPNLLHTVELKNQRGDVFYDKLKFIYIELPKFKKSLNQLNTHFDKWLFLFRHLADLTDRPAPLQDDIFNELFEIAEISQFSTTEQANYQNSLKYYRDMNNVVNTARQEGRKEGREEGKEEGKQEGKQEGLQEGFTKGLRTLVLLQLTQGLGSIPEPLLDRISTLPDEAIEALAVALLRFGSIDDLVGWLDLRGE